MCSGKGMRGKKTTFGSGKTGMTSASVIAGSRYEAAIVGPAGSARPPASRATGAREELQAEAAYARTGADAIDPGLYRGERRFELDAETPEHHNTRCEGGVGEREFAPAEECLRSEPVTEEVEPTPQLLARLIDALGVAFPLGLAHLCQEHRRRGDEGIVAVILQHADATASLRILRHEAWQGIFFLQVFIDYGRVVDDLVLVDQHRHLPVGI